MLELIRPGLEDSLPDPWRTISGSAELDYCSREAGAPTSQTEAGERPAPRGTSGGPANPKPRGVRFVGRRAAHRAPAECKRRASCRDGLP